MSATPSTIRALLERAANTDDPRVAVLGVDATSVSYADLHRSVREARLAMRAHGIGVHDTVAIALRNAPGLGVTILGIASAAACAPLNPTLSSPEAEYLLRDLGAVAVITEPGDDGAFVSAAKHLGIGVANLALGDGVPAWSSLAWDGTRRAPVSADEEPQPNDVALRLHTSGTTAAPKQVPLTHANITYAAANVVESLRLVPDDRCLNVMPLFHSHGLLGAFLSSLAAGASICCVERLEPRHFDDQARLVGATWYTAAPAVHAAVLPMPSAYAGFRLLRSASSPLPVPLIRQIEERYGAPMIEVYGMTEAYQIAANPLPPGERRPGSVGCPTGTEVAVLDRGEVRAVGEGEILVRGPNVFSGYASPADANDEAFVDGWFRTGDLGVLHDDGSLRITGRVKDIVNRGGEKIAPREVDDALLAEDGVLDALCFAVPDPILGEELAAALVVRPGSSISPADLRRSLATRLAPFKVPRHFVVVDAIPVGPGGKPMRRALQERFASLGSVDSSPHPTHSGVERAPGGDTYAVLEALWIEILGLPERPEPDDQFFDLGGTSLRVAELVGRIEDELDCLLPLDDVLAVPTLRTMAAEIDRIRERGATTRSHLSRVRAHDGGPVVVLVPGAHGNAIGLQAIAGHLDADFDVYTFSYPGGVPGETPMTSIDDLARHLVDELDVAGCSRPAVLFGNSLGSWVVYETARRLVEAGAEPPALVLGDMYSPTLRDGRGVERASFGTRLQSKMRKLLQRSRSRQRTFALSPAERRRQAVLEASARAQSSYRPGPYEGDLTLLVSENRGVRITRQAYGWTDLVRGVVTVRDAVGGHAELHIDNAELIARCIEASVRERS